jgi:hypothetical protein
MIVLLAVEQLCAGAAAALGGAALILIVGSDLLAWRWLTAVFVLGAAVGVWGTWRKLPDRYRIAQELDRRAGLSDLLSTAYYFRDGERRKQATAEVWEQNQESAESVSGSLDVSALIPWRTPRLVAAMGGLSVLLFGLMILRYGLTGSLDVRSPVVAGLNTFFGSSKEPLRQSHSGKKKPGEPPMGISVDDPSQERRDLDAAADEILAETLTPDVNAGVETMDSAKAERRELKAVGEEGAPLDEGEEGDLTASDSADGKAGSQEGSASEMAKSGKQQGQNSQQPKQEGAQSNLMDKMRDAMANLLAKLKAQNEGQKSSQQAQKGAQGGGETKGSQSAQNKKGSPSGKGSPTDDADGADEGQPGDQAQSGQGKGSDNGNDQQSQASAQSGMGKQDGTKDIKDAEQLAAMGKLSEIFGKRAQNLTGEIMVEVTSSRQQQLRTGYAQRGGTHREAGGEIQRDEVPLDLQPFVQQYFEQLRQSAPQTAEPKTTN